jgi:anti-sigma-K factor RskA
MCKRRQQDLLGLLIGALEDREQREIAEKCRADARLNRHLTRWRKRLRPLERFAATKVDPPPGLAERTFQIIFSQVELRADQLVSSVQVQEQESVKVPAPSGEQVGALAAVAALGVGPSAEFSFPVVPGDTVALQPVAIGGNPPGQDTSATVAFVSSREETGIGEIRALHLPEGRPASSGASASILRWSASRAETPLAGVISEAGWWRMILAVCVVVLIGLAIPPAIYHSHVQARSAYCRQVGWSLQPAIEHLLWLHDISRAHVNSGLDIFAHSVPAVRSSGSRWTRGGQELPLGEIFLNKGSVSLVDEKGRGATKQYVVLVDILGNAEGSLWLVPVTGETGRLAVESIRPGFAVVTWISTEAGLPMPGVGSGADGLWVGSESQRRVSFQPALPDSAWWFAPQADPKTLGPGAVGIDDPSILLPCGHRWDRFSAVPPSMGLARQVSIYLPGTFGVR